MRGLFITVEGIDGAGKSTQIAWLSSFLRGRGRDVVATREPGGTPLGERLRELLLAPERQIHAETETLLMFAARREHLAEIILPALAAGSVVLCDRFTDATYAYQGYGRGVELDKVRTLEQWAQRDLQPDLTILLDVPVELARQRAGGRASDRFELERTEFFGRVRAGYLQQARENPRRFWVIDGSAPASDIQKELEMGLLSRGIG